MSMSEPGGQETRHTSRGQFITMLLRLVSTTLFMLFRNVFAVCSKKVTTYEVIFRFTAHFWLLLFTWYIGFVNQSKIMFFSTVCIM